MDSRRILIIDGDASFRTNASRFLAERGYTVGAVAEAKAGLEAVRSERPRFVIVDIGLSEPGFDIVDALIALPEQPKVLCTAANARVPEVVAAVKAGALDVLERPVDGERLCRILDRADRPVAPRPAPSADVRGVRPVELSRDPKIDELVVDSDVMRAVLARVERLASQESTVVIEGEPGSGQEGVARHFHAMSPRARGPFVMVPRHPPQGVSPENMLFGAAETVSAFAQAKGGVVFVESLASLGRSGQDRLARLLQGLASARTSGGGVRWPPMVVGIERPIDVEVAAGRVPAELAQLLGRSPVVVPPIRQRREDIPELVQRALAVIQQQTGAAIADLEPAVLKDLVNRDWEGNVPELCGVIRRAACYDDEGRVVLDLSQAFRPPVAPIVRTLPTNPTPPPAPKAPEGWAPTLDDEGSVRPYDDYEAEIFRFALENAGGCVSRAAEMLGVGRATMYRKMRAYDIKVPPVSERSISRNRRRKRRDPQAGRPAAPRPAGAPVDVAHQSS